VAALVKRLKTAEIEPILILLPYHPVAFAGQEWDQELVDKVQERLGRDDVLLNLTRVFESDRMFADGMHLSDLGKAKLVEVLSETPAVRRLGDCS